MESILVLIVVSGLIAWVGDELGRRIGRKRLTIFGLRPKNTAVLVTIVTGMLITVFSLFVLAMISEEARFAIMEKGRIVDELRSLQKESERSQEEIGRLNADRQKLELLRESLAAQTSNLSKEVEILRNDIFATQKNLDALGKGELIFDKDEVLGYVVVRGKSEPDQLVEEFRKITTKIHEMAKNLGFVVNAPEEVWKQMKGPIRTFAEGVDEKTDMVVVLQTTERIARGQKLQLNVKGIPNKRIFRKSDVLESEIDGTHSRQEIRRDILKMVEGIQKIATEKQMVGKAIPDLDSETLYDFVNELKRRNCRLRVEIQVRADCWLTGPLLYSVGVFPLPAEK